MPTSSAGTWTRGRDAGLLLITWLVVNIAVAYLPHAQFQRKLVQGAHFPVAILAGIGASWFFSRCTWARNKRQVSLATIALVLFLSLSNVGFLMRDITNDMDDISQTYQHRPYIERGELEALLWIKSHTPQTDAIQPLPWVAALGRKLGTTDSTIACIAPGLIGRAVYAGHWGETPDFTGKLGQLSRFALPRTPDSYRLEVLRTMHVQYVVFTQTDSGDHGADQLAPMFRGLEPTPSYLVLQYRNPNAEVYQFVDPGTTSVRR